VGQEMKIGDGEVRGRTGMNEGREGRERTPCAESC